MPWVACKGVSSNLGSRSMLLLLLPPKHACCHSEGQFYKNNSKLHCRTLHYPPYLSAACGQCSLRNLGEIITSPKQQINVFLIERVPRRSHKACTDCVLRGPGGNASCKLPELLLCASIPCSSWAIAQWFDLDGEVFYAFSTAVVACIVSFMVLAAVLSQGLLGGEGNTCLVQHLQQP